MRKKDMNMRVVFDPAMDIVPPGQTSVVTEPAPRQTTASPEKEPVATSKSETIVTEESLLGVPKPEEVIARITAEREKLQQELLKVSDQKDLLDAQAELVSFLGGKVAVAVEFPMAYASSVIPFKEFRMHIAYSDDSQIFYASMEPRYWISEGGLVCATHRDVPNIMVTEAKLTSVLAAMELVHYCEPRPAKFRVVDVPVGSWERTSEHVGNPDFKGGTYYAMPEQLRSVIAINAIGSMIRHYQNDKGQTIGVFSAGMYSNAELARVFQLGDLKIVLR